jgi:hypothetical protein
MVAIREQGWECPKCLRVWAPKISACGACNDRQMLEPELIPRRIPTKQPGDFTPQWTTDDTRWKRWGTQS